MTQQPFQTRRKTAEEFMAGADTPAPVGVAPQTLPIAEATIAVATTLAPLYAARAPKVHVKDWNFQLKMKPELANKVERAFALRDPNVFASVQEMLQKMLTVALDAYIQSRS